MEPSVVVLLAGDSGDGLIVRQRGVVAGDLLTLLVKRARHAVKRLHDLAQFATRILRIAR